MRRVQAIAAVTATLTGLSYVPLSQAAQSAHLRTRERIAFLLPAHLTRLDHLVAVANINGRAVKLSRPELHGRRAVSTLTDRAISRARAGKVRFGARATARLSVGKRQVAKTTFTVTVGRGSASRRTRKITTSGTTAAGAGTTATTGTTATVSTTTGAGGAPGGGTAGPTGLPTGGVSAPGSSGADGPLLWAPPVLDSPTTIVIRSGMDPDVLNLSTSRDYILDMPAAAIIGTVEINGGHNVTLIGGQITVPSTADQTDNGADDTDTAIYVRDSTGTVHIEGVQIDGQADTMFDGIDINAPQATVDVENVRMTGLWGSYSMEHADAIQTWGGVKDLRVDDLTADGDYQGLMVAPNIGSVGSADFHNIDLTASAWPAALAGESSGGGTMIWLTQGTGTCTTTPMSFDDVYVANETGRIQSGSTVWPATNSTLPCQAHQTGDQVSWPNLPITGGVTLGSPPNGSFVPAGTAGVGYHTPGYAAQ
jgi:hypothetical protein